MAPRLRKSSEAVGKAKKKKPIEKSQRKTPEKLRGRRVCPDCQSFVFIRSFLCPTCNHKFVPKKQVITVESVFKKTSEKSILTILESNFFNSPQQGTEKRPYHQSKSKVLSSLPKLPEEVLVRTGEKTHKVKVYRPTKLTQRMRVFVAKNPIKAVCMGEYGLVFSEQVSAQPEGVKDNDRLTIKAHNIDHLHKLGHRYSGVSYLYISRSFMEGGYFRAEIKRNIVSIKLDLNVAAVLCGDGCVLFFCLPTISQTSEHQLLYLEESSQILDHNISVIAWIHIPHPALICGDFEGNIKIFGIDSSLKATCTRQYTHAHYYHITSISACPQNQDSCFLFATGGYDGYVKIWNYDQPEPIYQFDVTNKKVNSLVWDSGAKFLLVSRDDNSDGCSLLTFFSINKAEKKQTLVTECEQRYVKQYNYFEFLSSSPSSQCVALGSTFGNVEICNMEYFRKASIKKKNHSLSKPTSAKISITKKEGVFEIGESKCPVDEDSFALYQHVISDVSILSKNHKEKVAVSTHLGMLVVVDFESKDS